MLLNTPQNRTLYLIRFPVIVVFLLCMCSMSGVSIAQVSAKDSKRSFQSQVEGDKNDQPNLDGVVEVSFRIDKKGRAEILRINATSPTLADYVIKKLGKIRLEPGTTDGGKIIKYRFVFKKQA